MSGFAVVQLTELVPERAGKEIASETDLVEINPFDVPGVGAAPHKREFDGGVLGLLHGRAY